MFAIYNWPDIDTSVSNVTPAAWRIPGLESNVCSLVSLSANMIVCAAELPLESLCKDQNMFEAPDAPDQTILQNNNGHDEIISPKANHTPLKDTLLNLPRSAKNSIEDTSQIIAIKFQENKEPIKLFSVGITGLLTPDILHFEESLSVMVVGSNNQGVLQIFSVSQTIFTKLHDIVLENGGRPKGISSVPYDIPGPTKGVLIAVGSKLSTDSALPSSSSGSPMEIQIKLYPICKNNGKENDAEKSTEEMQRSNESSPRISGSDYLSRRYSNDLTESESGSVNLMKERKLSSGSSNLDSPRESLALQPPPRQKKNTKMRDSCDSGSESPREITLIKTENEKRNLVIDLNKSGSLDDLETESTDFSESKPNFSNDEVSKFFEESYNEKQLSKENAAPTTTKPSVSISSAGGDALVTDSSWTASDELNFKDLQTEINDQDKKIEDLKNRIENLCRIVEETSIVFPNKYQDMEKPDLVKVICQYEGDETRKKKFVLDNGRLKLELLKDVFGLTTVELYLDGEPCVIGANIDGYIPIRFQPSSTLS
ncbi:hypothetical protein KUTeg_006655 [Tegillarca granosa]|uniref:WD repeat and coiled-coil-containing protein n=1 Tax=Tegillarca granosa TaxID=220873 RepID=A0ABQ9FFQ7_TEGGR|nr:hypothetical protein KUTeg_006655 [Tegillarca granosa]